jgi:serine/threonine protein kinase
MALLISMELLEGEDLEQTIANRRPLTLLPKLDIMKQVAGGLLHAHVNGIVHREVKIQEAGTLFRFFEESEVWQIHGNEYTMEKPSAPAIEP